MFPTGLVRLAIQLAGVSVQTTALDFAAFLLVAFSSMLSLYLLFTSPEAFGCLLSNIALLSQFSENNLIKVRSDDKRIG